MFRITMLPAVNGDCIWIEYGEPEKPRRILIDGGVGETTGPLLERINELDESDRAFELLVITHIDNDHILGVLGLLQSPPDGFKVDDIWFNGWKHLPTDPGILGANEAEEVTKIIEEERLSWNRAFGGNRIALEPGNAALPTVTLADGMKMTVLGPALGRLGQLVPKWEDVVKTRGNTEPEEETPLDDGVLGGPSIDIERNAERAFKSDVSESNGSSIVLLAEFDGKKCLFMGDSFSDDIHDAIAGSCDQPFEIDALKVSHHGSRGNTSNRFLDGLSCSKYLISTNGFQHKHPSPEAISRILVHGRNAGKPVLHFNYASEFSKVWDEPSLKKSSTYGYRTVYPDIDGYLGIDL